MVIGAILLYIVSLAIFMSRALSLYSETERAMAWALFATSTVPFFVAASRKTRQVPLMLLVSAQYAVFFAFPVFFEGSIRTISGYRVPSSDSIDLTLLASMLALVGIAVGYVASGKLIRVRFSLLHFTPSNNRLFWFAFVSLCGSAAFQVGQGKISGWAPGTLSQPLTLILSADLGIAIMACLYYGSVLPVWKRGIAIALLVLATGVGVAGGMFQSAVQPLVIWFICRWILRGKVPLIAFAVLTAAFFLFQPVKGSYRKLVWFSGRSFTSTEKIAIYGRLLKNQWLDGGRSNDIVDISRESAQKRLSLLLTTAHYVEWTPYPIDYKNGSTLGFLFYGWIPRAVWPNKPIAQEANKILPLEYSLQDLSNQNSTMFGVGHVAEGYANFGLLGIFPLFIVLGVLYRIPQLMLERQRSLVTIAVFVAVTLAMVPIGSSIGNAFGGFLQQIIVQVFLLRVFTRERRSKSAAARATAIGARQHVPGSYLSAGSPPLERS